MHPTSEYVPLVTQAWKEAVRLVTTAHQQGYPEGTKLMRFLARHAAIAYPSSDPGGFGIGEWIAKEGSPSHQGEVLSIMFCMHDDTPPEPRIPQVGGNFNKRAQLITVYDANLFSPIDRAIILLHEAYHARHRIGLALEGFIPTDPEYAHETNAWTFVYNIMEVGIGEKWLQLVRQDVADIPRRLGGLSPAHAGEIIFSPVEQYPFLMDVLFGKTVRDVTQEYRKLLLGVRSNILYWSHTTGMPQEQVAGTIILNTLYTE